MGLLEEEVESWVAFELLTSSGDLSLALMNKGLEGESLLNFKDIQKILGR